MRGWSNADHQASFWRVDVHAGADFEVLPRLREGQEPAMNLDRIPASIPLTDAPWISWRDMPPQLQEPILVSHWPREEGSQVVMLDTPKINRAANAWGLFWLPSGLYREEFWRVTGEWK